MLLYHLQIPGCFDIELTYFINWLVKPFLQLLKLRLKRRWLCFHWLLSFDFFLEMNVSFHLCLRKIHNHMNFRWKFFIQKLRIFIKLLNTRIHLILSTIRSFFVFMHKCLVYLTQKPWDFISLTFRNCCKAEWQSSTVLLDQSMVFLVLIKHTRLSIWDEHWRLIQFSSWFYSFSKLYQLF